MQYIITLPDTQQAYALLDFLKSAGIATSVKALKTELSGTTKTIEKQTFEIPERTDEELKQMILHKRRTINPKEVNNEKKMF